MASLKAIFAPALVVLPLLSMLGIWWGADFLVFICAFIDASVTFGDAQFVRDLLAIVVASAFWLYINIIVDNRFQGAINSLVQEVLPGTTGSQLSEKVLRSVGSVAIRISIMACAIIIAVVSTAKNLWEAESLLTTLTCLECIVVNLIVAIDTRIQEAVISLIVGIINPAKEWVVNSYPRGASVPPAVVITSPETQSSAEHTQLAGED